MVMQTALDAAIMGEVAAAGGDMLTPSITTGLGPFSYFDDGNLFNAGTVSVVRLAGGAFIVIGAAVVSLVMFNTLTGALPPPPPRACAPRARGHETDS